MKKNIENKIVRVTHSLRRYETLESGWKYPQVINREMNHLNYYALIVKSAFFLQATISRNGNCKIFSVMNLLVLIFKAYIL